MTTPTTLTTTQLMWLCAMYEQQCLQPVWVGTSTGKPLHGTVFVERCECKGTNRIPLLEGVREPCRKIHSVYYRKGLTSGVRSVNCQEAGCLGWTPTEEAWTWLVLPGSIHFSKKHYKRLAFSALKGESCFFTALEEPLRPLAINAAEAEQFVKENVK